MIHQNSLDVKNWQIIIKNNAITGLKFLFSPKDRIESAQNLPLLCKELHQKAKQELKEYFAGQRKTFDLPLLPQGTAFQLKVWEQLQKIPSGQTVSYKDIAIKIGNANAARAVGHACNANPIPIFIPCHRVVGANNSLTGFALGLDIKKALLEMEQGDTTLFSL